MITRLRLPARYSHVSLRANRAITRSHCTCLICTPKNSLDSRSSVLGRRSSTRSYVPHKVNRTARRFNSGPFRPTSVRLKDKKDEDETDASKSESQNEDDAQDEATKKDVQKSEQESKEDQIEHDKSKNTPKDSESKRDKPDDRSSGAPASKDSDPGVSVNTVRSTNSARSNQGNPWSITRSKLNDLGQLDEYPALLALPVTKKPLYPGFYKIVSVKDPVVKRAIREIEARTNPYIATFLLKDENADTDIVRSPDEIYNVGTLSQVTSMYESSNGDLSVVLYPHRRLKLKHLYPASGDRSNEPEKTNAKTEDKKDDEKKDDKKQVRRTKAKKIEEPYTERPVAEAPDGSGEDSQDVTKRGPPWTTEYLTKYDVSRVEVSRFELQPYERNDPTVTALVNEINSVYQDILHLLRSEVNNAFVHSINQMIQSERVRDAASVADAAAAMGSGTIDEFQGVLSSDRIEERLRKALTIIKNESMSVALQKKISGEVEKKIATRNREFLLNEQLRGIKRELGIENDGKDSLVQKFRERAANLKMPEAAKKVFDDEISKMSTLEPSASEFNVTRNYLDWLTSIPWGLHTTENFSIKNAMTVLEEDHYGMKDIKDRILEFVAVGKLRGTVEGKILCFVGPPGVGKTSIGKSIARALNRHFFRFSVGGLSDVAEIKGHRRTYIGAMPGKVVQALKKVQTENPLIMIDEIDKLGRGIQGDPASALLELLDSEQHSAFLDHYLDVPVDLSHTLFVCTANGTDTIPAPLLDRMEIIELSGYIANEKVSIAERFLVPQAKEAAGLKDANVLISTDAIETLVKQYCRESGVRSLKKHIEKVFRKSSLNIVRELGEEALPESEAITASGQEALEQGKKQHDTDAETQDNEAMKSQEGAAVGTTTKPRKPLVVPESVNVAVTNENLKDFVGPPVFLSDRLYETTPIGVVMGLAWTNNGGAALYIEAILEQTLKTSKGSSFRKTGQLGDVMKESTDLAYSYAKSYLAKHFPDNRFFEKANVHLHCPTGAVPKDGPSAGITMTSALLSLALDTPINATVALTGEITLTGKVLRIGGLREKAVAAKRSGIETILFPIDNKADWDELPDHIKEGLTGIPVSWYDEVFDVLFQDINKARANTLWKADIEAADAQMKRQLE